MPYYSGLANSGHFNVQADVSAHIVALKDAMLACGWTLYSSGTDDYTLQSGTTPQGYSMRARIKKNNTTSFAFAMESPYSIITNYGTGNFHAVNWFSSYGINWFGSPYQFFALLDSYPDSYGSSSQRLCFAGVPWMPSFLTPGAVGMSNISGDGGIIGSATRNFRTALYYNATWYGTKDSYNPAVLFPVDVCMHKVDDLILVDPYLHFDSIESTSGVIGALWDAVWAMGQFGYGTEITYDGKVWQCVSHLPRDYVSAFLLKTADV